MDMSTVERALTAQERGVLARAQCGGRAKVRVAWIAFVVMLISGALIVGPDVSGPYDREFRKTAGFVLLMWAYAGTALIYVLETARADSVIRKLVSLLHTSSSAPGDTTVHTPHDADGE